MFIPYPFSGICGSELCTIRDNLAALAARDAEVLVITCDTIPVNKRWAEDNSFTFPILSDFWPHGEVARAYGCFDDRFGVANRSTFTVDGSGTVTDVFASGSLGTARDFDAYLPALEDIN